jgi:hypothetical protein
MWWWQFNNEEPLQEDLIVFEKLMEMRRDRQKMDKRKAEQKQASEAAKQSGKSVSHASYNIPDPTN